MKEAREDTEILYLAQVQKQSGQAGLRLLAAYEEESWAIVRKQEVLWCKEAAEWDKGMLVLAEVAREGRITNIRDATGWILYFVEQYLTSDITPEFLREEADRAEQWRHKLTLESQEIARRKLEVEARLEQIQALSESLKQREKKLEQRENELKAREQKLKGYQDGSQ